MTNDIRDNDAAEGGTPRIAVFGEPIEFVYEQDGASCGDAEADRIAAENEALGRSMLIHAADGPSPAADDAMARSLGDAVRAKLGKPKLPLPSAPSWTPPERPTEAEEGEARGRSMLTYDGERVAPPPAADSESTREFLSHYEIVGGAAAPERAEGGHPGGDFAQYVREAMRRQPEIAEAEGGEGLHEALAAADAGRFSFDDAPRWAAPVSVTVLESGRRVALTSEEAAMVADLLRPIGKNAHDLHPSWLSDHPKVRRFQLLDGIEFAARGDWGSVTAARDEEFEASWRAHEMLCEAAAAVASDPEALAAIAGAAVEERHRVRTLGDVAHVLAAHSADDDTRAHSEQLRELNERRRALYRALLAGDVAEAAKHSYRPLGEGAAADPGIQAWLDDILAAGEDEFMPVASRAEAVGQFAALARNGDPLDDLGEALAAARAPRTLFTDAADLFDRLSAAIRSRHFYPAAAIGAASVLLLVAAFSQIGGAERGDPGRPACTAAERAANGTVRPHADAFGALVTETCVGGTPFTLPGGGWTAVNATDVRAGAASRASSVVLRDRFGNQTRITVETAPPSQKGIIR
jgi:hypothetical protein